MSTRLLHLPVLVVIAAVASACGDSPATSSAPTPTLAPEPTPSVTTYQLNTTVWYEGLLIHVDRAVATLDERGGPVEVALRIENPGADDAQLDAPINLIVDGEPVDPTRESQVPIAPANSLVGAVMRYELQGVPSVDRAVVRIGAPPLHAGLVPLTPAAGEPLVFEPVPLELAGSGTAGDIKLSVRSGLLRWDLPDWSQELVAGLKALTVTYDVSYAGDFPGGFAFTGDNVALRLPNGSIIGARRDGHSQSVELIAPGKVQAGLFSRFEVPADMTGKFQLLVRNGTVTKGIPFTIEP